MFWFLVTNMSLAVTLLSSRCTELETDRNVLTTRHSFCRAPRREVWETSCRSNEENLLGIPWQRRWLDSSDWGDIKSGENRNLFILPECEKIIKIHLYWKPFFFSVEGKIEGRTSIQTCQWFLFLIAVEMFPESTLGSIRRLLVGPIHTRKVVLFPWPGKELVLSSPVKMFIDMKRVIWVL